MQKEVNNKKLVLQVGDITKYRGDVIVNAANPFLAGGGGVDGAIHKAGGYHIMRECKKIISEIERLPSGKAVITSAGHLQCDNVIHTVGPVYKIDPKKAPAILKSAYFESLKLADKMALNNIAFPSISTGSYGYPLEAAAQVAMETVVTYLKSETDLQEVHFYLFTNNDYQAYAKALEKIFIN